MARKLRNTRPCAPWGAIAASLIGTAINAGTSLYGSYQQSKLAQQQLEEQEKNLQQQQKQINNSNIVSTLNNYFNSELYQEPDYYSYANGGRVRNNRLRIIDGGIGIPVGDGLVLLRGNTHNEINESGKTGIGVKIGNKEIEAEDGEVLNIKPNRVDIISNRLTTPDGLTMAEAVEAGADPNEIMRYQQGLKRRLNIKDDPRFGTSPVKRSKAEWGASWKGVDYATLGVNTILPFLTKSVTRGAINKQLQSFKDLEDSLSLSNYTAPGYVSMDTDFRQHAKHAQINRDTSNKLRLVGSNTASANVGRELGQNAITEAALEHNKVFDEDALRNLEARIKNNEQYNQYLQNYAEGRNRFLTQAAAIKGDLIGQKNALFEKKSNLPLIQGLGDAWNIFAQTGIDRKQFEDSVKLLSTTMQGKTGERLAGTLPDYNFNNNPEQNITTNANNMADVVTPTNASLRIKPSIKYPTTTDFINRLLRTKPEIRYRLG